MDNETKKRTISTGSIVVASENQTSTNLDEEMVILNMESGIYYGLDGVGAHIWNQIQEPRSVGQIRDSIRRKYQVEPERCERDLLLLLQKLANAGLIEIRDETSV